MVTLKSSLVGGGGRVFAAMGQKAFTASSKFFAASVKDFFVLFEENEHDQKIFHVFDLDFIKIYQLYRLNLF